MLNHPSHLKVEESAMEALQEVLSEVPFLRIYQIEPTPVINGQEQADFIVHMDAKGQPHNLVCEAKSNGQPRYARAAIHQLQSFVRRYDSQAFTPVFIAPFISEQTQRMCRDNGVGYLDFQGNCLLVWEGVFIERRVPTKSPSERRELRSLFTRKSAQVLRVLMEQPGRAWRVVDLAERANVSIGHVSNIRRRLLDQEWASSSDDGIVLTNAAGLLAVWRDAYTPPEGRRLQFYTPLHGSSLDDALRNSGISAGSPPEALLASFSAAKWLAPYARNPNEYFYATEKGLDRLKSVLHLSPTDVGSNVIVTRTDDPTVYASAVTPALGIGCTNPLLTYLDLSAAGERGREAADHLRKESFPWL